MWITKRRKKREQMNQVSVEDYNNKSDVQIYRDEEKTPENLGQQTIVLGVVRRRSMSIVLAELTDDAKISGTQ